MKHKDRIMEALDQYRKACDEGEDKASEREAIETDKTIEWAQRNVPSGMK